MSDPFSNSSTTSDLVRLKQFLNESLYKAGVDVPDQSRLLNLACGRADESAVLADVFGKNGIQLTGCLLYTSPSPRDKRQSRMPSSA